MKPILLAALAALLAVPSFAQKKESAPNKEEDSQKLYLKTEKGGEAIFKKPEVVEKKIKKYKGISKKKGPVYEKEAEKWINKENWEKLPAEDKKKVKELAEEAAMLDDVKMTVDKKLKDEKDAKSKEKLEAAKGSLPEWSKGVEDKMKAFEKEKKIEVFKKGETMDSAPAQKKG